MSLDLNLVAGQIGDMIDRLQESLDQQQQRVRGALDVLHEAGRDLPALKKKIEKSKTTWLVAGIVDGLADRHRPGTLPPDFAVLATDGSHIAVDRHRAARCYLLNISHVILRYGAQPDAVLESVPRLYADEKDLFIFPSGGKGREQLIDANLLSAIRSVEECRHLADLAATVPAGGAVLALLDGTLMLWGLEAYADFVTEALLDKGLIREFDRIRNLSDERKVALASYISATRSTDVVNALRVWTCPHEASNCDTYCPPTGKRDCDTLAGTVDAHLFMDLLAPGERSAVFASRSKVVKDHYAEHAVHFFYLRVDDEIARVEMPQWVAETNEMVGLTHNLVLDQCRRGDGYPVALSEAHEQAVVTTADKNNFWTLVEEGLVQQRMSAPSTGKDRSKRTRWV